MRRKSCKTRPLYEKVDRHSLISSFSKMIQVKPLKDLLKVKMAGRVITPAGNKFFHLLDRHFCILVSFFFFFKNSPIANKLKNLSLLGKSEIYH